MKSIDCYKFYQSAKHFVMNSEYLEEVQHVDQLDFTKTTPGEFMGQYAFVVLNTGMKNQVAESMMKKLVDSDWNPDTINHQLKRKAIIQAINNYPKWFDELKLLKTDRARVEYLGTLFFIGKITKYHLARNIGIDCAKPDRHLMLLSKKFEFDTPRQMCEYLSRTDGVKVGVIDVILWRYCNLHPDVVKQMKQDVLI